MLDWYDRYTLRGAQMFWKLINQSSDAMKGFLAAIAVMLLTFIFTIKWDLTKVRRDKEEREELIIHSVREEFSTNSQYLKENISSLETELQLYSTKRFLLTPLFPLQSGGWDLIKVSGPLTALKKEEALNRVRSAYQLIARFNGLLVTREDFRIHNQPLSNFHDQLNSYDKSMLGVANVLVKELDELGTILDNKQ